MMNKIQLGHALVLDTDQGISDEYILDVSVDLIEDGLYLGNVACARDYPTLEKLQITHILTLDVVPLPRSICERPNLTCRYLRLADVPKEDLVSHLPKTNEFIKQAIGSGGVVLVHCHFGVSRSSAVVIAYLMEKYSFCYEDAFALAKSKRRFVGPNIGFVAQLKLFGHMGYTVNKEDPRYKQFRLKLAGQKFKQVKILPQKFADLVKPDPGLVREKPEPVVYRCKRCRRVLANQSNIIPHIPKNLKVKLAKKGMRPPPSELKGLPENREILMDKLKSLEADMKTMRCEDDSQDTLEQSTSQQSHNKGTDEIRDGYSETCMVDPNIAARADLPDTCRLTWFVEPMAWMKDVSSHESGKLNCPRCRNKVGNFSWVMGCRCPCDQKVAPAFYLVPSKVEWSNIVQNVQTTV